MAKRRARRGGGRGGYRISQGGQYKMTPKRRAALKKAQIASARKRKGMSTKSKVGIGVGVTSTVALGAVLGTGIVRHRISGSQLSVTVGRGRQGEMVPSRPSSHVPSTNHYAQHGSTGMTVQRGPRRRDRLGIHHRTRMVQDPTDTHIAKANGVQITMTGDTPFRQEHLFGISIPGIGRIGARYQHRGVSGDKLKKALSSPKDVSKIVFGKKIPSGLAPPQGRGMQKPAPHVPGGRHITQAQRDAIPFRKGKSAPKSNWPHTSEDKSRIQNEGLRNGTHYLHPTKGVIPFPESARGRRAVESKILAWKLGGDRGILPRGWWDE